MSANRQLNASAVDVGSDAKIIKSLPGISAKAEVTQRFTTLPIPSQTTSADGSTSLEAKSTEVASRYPSALPWLRRSRFNEFFADNVDSHILLYDRSFQEFQPEVGKTLLGYMVGRLFVLTENKEEVPKEVMDYCWELTSIAKAHVRAGMGPHGSQESIDAYLDEQLTGL